MFRWQKFPIEVEFVTTGVANMSTKRVSFKRFKHFELAIEIAEAVGPAILHIDRLASSYKDINSAFDFHDPDTVSAAETNMAK